MPLSANPVKSVAITSMSAGAERRAIVALLTAFALMVQALIPSLASAAPMSLSDMVLCTEQGLQSAPAGSVPAQTPPGHACQHCICPAIATTLPPVVSILAVAYVVTEALVTATPCGTRPAARAPPRPPGQGPPLSNA